MTATDGIHNASATKRLHYFGQIVVRHHGPLGDLLHSVRTLPIFSKSGDSTESVFDGVREHPASMIFESDIFVHLILAVDS